MALSLPFPVLCQKFSAGVSLGYIEQIKNIIPFLGQTVLYFGDARFLAFGCSDRRRIRNGQCEETEKKVRKYSYNTLVVLRLVVRYFLVFSTCNCIIYGSGQPRKGKKSEIVRKKDFT